MGLSITKASSVRNIDVYSLVIVTSQLFLHTSVKMTVQVA